MSDKPDALFTVVVILALAAGVHVVLRDVAHLNQDLAGGAALAVAGILSFRAGFKSGRRSVAW